METKPSADLNEQEQVVYIILNNLCYTSTECNKTHQKHLCNPIFNIFGSKLTTGRMAIINRTCISFCNQPKAHYLATSRESRRYVVAYSRFAGAACRHLATSSESKAHFGLPWIRHWDYRGKCYMDGKRIQCLSNASQHVPIN